MRGPRGQSAPLFTVPPNSYSVENSFKCAVVAPLFLPKSPFSVSPRWGPTATHARDTRRHLRPVCHLLRLLSREVCALASAELCGTHPRPREAWLLPRPYQFAPPTPTYLSLGNQARPRHRARPVQTKEKGRRLERDWNEVGKETREGHTSWESTAAASAVPLLRSPQASASHGIGPGPASATH